MTSRVWSAQQTEIFKWAESDKGNALVRARAGTGKTTTILEAINHAPERRILLSAFNKKIAEELQERLTNPNAEAKTLHGLGFGCILRNWSSVQMNNARGKRLAEQACGQGTPGAVTALVAKIAELSKQIAPFAKTPEEIVSVALRMDCLPDVEWEEAGWTVERIGALALRAMGLAQKRDGTVDFSDMLYLPLAMGWVAPRYDLVCIDEAQDMNTAQIELALRSVSREGRIVVVGDDRQAIYGFRGADSGSLDRLKVALKAQEFPLTVTYRCASQIVGLAQDIVPDFEATPGAPEGTIRTIPGSRLAQEVQPGDFVISRKNAPLVRTCLSILRTGKRAKVEGKDIGKSLLSLIRKFKADSIEGLLKSAGAWAEREIKRVQALAESKPELAEHRSAEIDDTFETIRVLAEGMSTVGDLEKRIEALFEDGVGGRGGVVVCSTIHRVKGLEADRAFILKGSLATGKRAQKVEELNCLYVAITRAKNELVWVE